MPVETEPRPTPQEEQFEFLSLQVGYCMSHLQIADAKAAGVIAYVAIAIVLVLDLAKAGTGPTLILAASSIGLMVGALIVSFLCVLPRVGPGHDPHDTFSWVGLSNQASAGPYQDRIERVTRVAQNRAIADTVESVSRIVRTKYRYVQAAVLLSVCGSLMAITAAWLAL